MGSNIDLEDRVAVISGGARGIGRSTAELFVELGAKVVIGDVRFELAQEVASEIGPEARAVPLNVSHEADWNEAVTTAQQWGHGVHILVNNAGVSYRNDVLSTSLDDFTSVIAVNEIGVFLGMKTVCPAIIESGGGSVINVASTVAMASMAELTAYTASKWAVRGMSKSAALDLARRGVRVNTILPGNIDTPMNQESPFSAEERLRILTASTPLGRVGQPTEIAWMAAFLASDRSAFCTGGDFVVDGGWTLGGGAAAVSAPS